MTDVKRYSATTQEAEPLFEDAEGDLVKFTDYEALNNKHLTVARGLQSLVAALRHELKVATDAKRKGGPKVKPLIDIGTKKDGAEIVGHDKGLHILKCGCGAIFRRGRTPLMSKTPWRCAICYKDGMRETTIRLQSQK